jgi:segregation and condensation protein B
MNTLSTELQLDYITKVIEACLLTASSPISINQLFAVFDSLITKAQIERIINELDNKYANSGIELIKTIDGYRFRSRIELQHYINKLYSIKPPKYSRSILETLAIIAYRQPVTRGDIEEIRGITVNSNIIQTLTERGWIEVIGHKQVPGKPELLATTKKLLEDLGIESLERLPSIDTPQTQEYLPMEAIYD